jgi:hypothetical protein
MSSNREKKLNKSDVRVGIWKFILSFAVLSVVSFVCVLFFFKSYDTQREGIRRESDAYKDLIDRSDVLKKHVDNIYDRMVQLNTNKVENEIFLRSSIMDNVRDAKNIMGKDSTKSFKHYTVLMKQIETMLSLKNNISTVEYRKSIALRDLRECMNKSDVATKELKIDPTRKFTGGRRK